VCTAAVDASGPGDVIVVAHEGRVDVAGWGGILSLGAITHEVEGVIVDGACRDVDESAELALPIYARATVPVTARGRVVEKSWNEPIKVGGVAVAPGDFVLADGSGVVFLPAAHADAIISAAERIARREAAMAAEVRAGKPLAEVMNRSYEELAGKL
jgi:4-hydroxy-4-methyl-2-oxoglutarate aldolase